MSINEEEKQNKTDKTNLIATIATILLERHVTKGSKRSSRDRIQRGYLKLPQRAIDSAVELAQRIILTAETQPEIEICANGCNANDGRKCMGVCVRVNGHDENSEDPEAASHKCDGGHIWG